MFEVKGASVYPSEVEAALRSLAPVRQAFATDVPTPAAGGAGDGPVEVGAIVVTDEPVEVIAAAVKPRLSAFEVPTRWLVTGDVRDVPMTATGKVDKAALRERLRGAPAP